MFGSQTATTRRMMACLSPTGKPLRYGPELVKFSLNLHALLEHLEGMDPGVARGKDAEAMLVASIDQMVHRCPGKLADELSKQIASMEQAKLEKLTDLVDLHSRYEAEKPSGPRAAVHVVDGEVAEGRGAEVGKEPLGKEWCGMGCKGDLHWLSMCPTYRRLNAKEKLATVVKLKRCQACLSNQHQTPCPMLWECRHEGCTGKHHRSLHYAFPEAEPHSFMAVSHQAKSSFLGLQRVMVMEARGVVKGVEGVVKMTESVVLYDIGSNIHVVTEQFAVKAGLEVYKTRLDIGIPGSSLTSEMCCELPLVDNEGDVHIVTAAIVPVISKAASGMPAVLAALEFGEQFNFGEIIQQDVDIIIGSSDPAIYPREVRRSGTAYLHESRFGGQHYVTGFSAISTSKEGPGRQRVTCAGDPGGNVVEQFLEGPGRQRVTCAGNQVGKFVVNRRSASLDPNLVDSFWRLAGVAWINSSRMAEYKQYFVARWLDLALVDRVWKLIMVAWMNSSRMAGYKQDPVGLL